MVTYLLPILFFCLSAIGSSGLEEQRKYIVNPEKLNLQNLRLIEPFIFYPHSQYITYDIYFDSPDWRIKNSSQSLRLRRVEKKKGKWEYSIQLKSEMEQLGQVRMEIEHKDLFSQKVGSEALTDLINQFIENESARPTISEKLTTWMSRKKESSLAPFQKLRLFSIDPGLLRPVVWGHSSRQRFHVFTEKNSALAKAFYLKKSEKNSFLVPDFFKKQPGLIWLMEASFDQSDFHDVFAEKKEAWMIHELEIENKFRPRKVGTLLLNEIEKRMELVWGAKASKDSKYLSTIGHFYPEETK